MRRDCFLGARPPPPRPRKGARAGSIPDPVEPPVRPGELYEELIDTARLPTRDIRTRRTVGTDAAQECPGFGRSAYAASRRPISAESSSRSSAASAASTCSSRVAPTIGAPLGILPSTQAKATCAG